AHIRHRLARRHAERVVERLMADAEAEREAPAAHLMQVSGGLRQLVRIAAVDVDDAGGEAEGGGRMRERVEERHARARLRAEDPLIAAALDLAYQGERVAPAAGHRDQRQAEVEWLWHDQPPGP